VAALKVLARPLLPRGRLDRAIARLHAGVKPEKVAPECRQRREKATTGRRRAPWAAQGNLRLRGLLDRDVAQLHVEGRVATSRDSTSKKGA
jgi:hypothetical protein